MVWISAVHKLANLIRTFLIKTNISCDFNHYSMTNRILRQDSYLINTRPTIVHKFHILLLFFKLGTHVKTFCIDSVGRASQLYIVLNNSHFYLFRISVVILKECIQYKLLKVLKLVNLLVDILRTFKSLYWIHSFSINSWRSSNWSTYWWIYWYHLEKGMFGFVSFVKYFFLMIFDIFETRKFSL